MSAWTSQTGWAQEHNTDQEQLSFDGMNQCSVRLRGPWATRHAVAAELLGNALVGKVWPYVPCGAIVSRCGIQGAPNASFTVDGNGLIQYDDAIIDVHFSVSGVGQTDQKTAPDGSLVLYTESLEPTIEYISLDHKEFKWKDTNGRTLNEHEAPSRRVRGMNLIRSVFNVPAIDASAIDLVGKTNDKAYTSTVLGLDFDIETLLWIPPTSSRSVTLQGLVSGSAQRGWNFVFKWGFRRAGWNKGWQTDKSGGADWEDIYDTVTSSVYKNFPPADMSNFLF